MGWWDDVKNGAVKYGVDYNLMNPVAAYNAISDASNGSFNPTNKSTSALSAAPVVDAITDKINPAKPYDHLADAMAKIGADAKALSSLQWSRQMEGLGKALGYVNHSQNAWDRVYGQPRPAPGATMPQGLAAALPTQMSGMQQGAPGLAGLFGRGR